MSDLKGFLDTYFSWIFKAGLVIVILATLFLFTNLTTEFYDTPKFLVLLAFSAVLLVLTTLRYTVSNKVIWVRTPLDIPLLLLLAGGVVSTLLSQSPYVALLGNQLRIHGSLVSIILYVIFYFVLVNNLKGAKTIKWFTYIIVVGAVALSAITLIAYAGVKVLPPPWTHGINFTPTGSSFSTTAVLALLVPIVTNQILTGANLTTQLLNSLFLTVFAVTIALTGSFSTWIAGALGFVLVLLTNKQFNLSQITQLKPTKLIGLIIPLVAVLLIAVLSFIPPMGKAQNPLYSQAKNFPRELQLPFINSWKISISAFRDMPILGTGPSTYLFDFTNYKPLEYNSTSLWNLRFDTSFNEYLQTLATLGGIGLLALLSLTAVYISAVYKPLATEGKDGAVKALAVSGLVFFTLLVLHPSTLALWVIGLILIASFIVLNQDGTRSYDSNIKQTLMRFASFSSMESSTETIRIDALPSILLVISLALVLVTGFFTGKFALADYHHRMALNAVAQNNGILAYNELVTAEKLNSIQDLYRTDLAQTNFALANAIASAKGPTEASPAGFLTDQDKQNIQVLLQQSINEGRVATTLSPKSAVNWEILALLYRQISGVAQNALVFSLDSYGKAIFQDPLNPLLRLNVGGTYYAIKNYDLAIRFFTDAINLKPDFANGYYNLSVAYRDKGDLTSALAAAQKAVELVDKNSADYKVANDYLNDLKTKQGTSAEGSTLTSPDQNQQALQQQGLPKVVNVGTPPEKIATPTAVKKPNSTPEPSATP